MPPKKEKKEQFTGDQASDMILEYLTQQNRPYSATDISSNLHNSVTKITAAKLLKEMHESGEIEGRVSGKQVVYHASQDPKERASEEDLKALDEDIEGIKKETTVLKAKFKEAQASLLALKSTPSLACLKDSVETIRLEVQELETALATLRASATKPVDSDKKAEAEAEYARIEKIFFQRRKQFRDFWGMICDGYEGDHEELWERIGLEGEQ